MQTWRIPAVENEKGKQLQEAERKAGKKLLIDCVQVQSEIVKSIIKSWPPLI